MTTKKGPLIPIAPSFNLIVVEPIKVKSKLEKDQLKKDNKVVLTKDAISNRNRAILEESGDITSVWDEHPKQAVIVALSDKLKEETGYNVGDKVAWRIDEGVGTLMVFHKKRYIGLYQHDILFRYLTDEV